VNIVGDAADSSNALFNLSPSALLHSLATLRSLNLLTVVVPLGLFRRALNVLVAGITQKKIHSFLLTQTHLVASPYNGLRIDVFEWAGSGH
jgi:hypothetical protein